MTKIVDFLLPIVIVFVAFVAGYRAGESDVKQQWQESENEALTAYKTKALEAIKEKDDEIKRLNADLANLSKSRSDIVRKLDTYKARERTLAECRNDRARMADVASRLDDYSHRLLTRTRSMIDSKNGQ